jgi:hypothetical protein
MSLSPRHADADAPAPTRITTVQWVVPEDRLETPSSSIAWRRFQKAFLLSASLVDVGCLIYVLEKYVVRPQRRFMENPAEMMMRVMGIAHFLLGWLFLLTSRRLHSGAAVGRHAFFGLIGAGLCLAYAEVGGSRQPLVLFGFYVLFLIHEVGDECELARRGGDIPRDSPFGPALARAFTLLMITVLATMHLGRGWLFDPSHLAGLPAVYLWTGLAALMLATGFYAWRLAPVGRTAYGSLAGALDAHAPLVRVYQALLAILAVGSLFGSLGLNLVILLHVAVWLVYVAERRSGAGQGGSVLGGRGFVVLHLGLAAVLLVLLAVRVQVWERAGWWSAMLSSSSFPYWSLMHICLAFGVRKS